MRARDRAPGGPRGEHTARARGAAEDGRPGGKAPDRGAGRTRRATEWGRAKYAGSWAENLGHRLGAFDLLTHALQLAATLLLCAVPFVLITSALAGRSAVSALSLRLGLSHEAAADIGGLFASSVATSGTVTGMSWVFFILGGLATSASLQRLYQQMFRLRPQGPRDRLRSLAWLAGVVGWAALGTSVGKVVYDSAPVLWWILNVPAFIAFWWFTMWFLLAGRVAWRRLLPCAVATALYWMGMLVFFHFVFSDMVTDYDREYGPIGVVFALMSLFIAIGVVIILGAATGMMWHDRGMSLRAAAARMRRAS
ncbi:YhjD/YihY/BrkB family envelope integrity protein [Kitasatospora sp. NPDC047058]|uniref:YhjD/YihY/BrkB family envelope integrity protein n=1 Tax=Kitasatospora sp. NPDC047058 TaxID=3155620 RepID=UPI0033F01494